MTNHFIDMKNADVIVIMGSNFAENHPVGFQWVMEAVEKNNALLIHVDPRFTRTSSVAHKHVPMRSGSDIAFLGGMINHLLAGGKIDRDYVANYTNAPFIISDKYAFTEGVFSGLDAEKRSYNPESWQYEKGPDGKPKLDPTLNHPRSVFQLLKAHYSRYDIETVVKITGTRKEDVLFVYDAMASTSVPDRSGFFAYAMGWTQHSNGVQHIRTAAMIQLLLGNMGVPGGGINALRGHANVQGATDLAVLFHDLPGYLGLPAQGAHANLKEYLDKGPKAGFWVNRPAFVVSLLKAWYGDAARKENDFCFDYLPKSKGEHSFQQAFNVMAQGKIKGAVCLGQNPMGAGPNAAQMFAGLSKLDWLVSIDLFVNETAEFWKSHQTGGLGHTADPAAIKTEVFVFPAATVVEKSGSLTNSGRWIQWHEQGPKSPGDAKTDAVFTIRLGQALKKLYAGSAEKKDRPILDMTWDYGEKEEEIPARVLKEINGYAVKDVLKDGKAVVKAGEQLPSFIFMRDDGSTAGGCWIYTGVFAKENKAASRKADKPGEGIGSNLGWSFAWPANRRILYNRASADLAGKPRSDRKKVIWWDANAENPDGKKGKWAGLDVPDFGATMAPDAKPSDKGLFVGIGGMHPFIMNPEGRGRLFAAALKDGPFPEHYEPVETPVENVLSKQKSSPVAKIYKSDKNPIGTPDKYPYVLTTYRLTEHHLAGAMTRNLPWLAELMPNLFFEISKELAGDLGIKPGEMCTISSARGSIKAQACVTERLKPMTIAGRKVHEIGLPWHWGFKGIAVGDVANTLVASVGDPNVFIQESKALLCDVKKGG